MNGRRGEMMLRCIVTSLLLFLIFGGLSVPASAVAIGVSETKLDFGPMNPGDNGTLSSTVVNMCDEPIMVNIRLEGENADWLSVSPSELNLSARTSKPINVTFTVPKIEGLEPGDHFAYVTVVGYPQIVEGEGTQIRIGSGVRITAWARLPGIVIKSGEIVSFNAPDVEQGNIEEFEALFKTTGNVRVRAYPNVTITQEDKIVGVAQGGEVTVMPGETKRLITKWDTAEIPLGEYRATAMVYYDGNMTGELSDNFTIGVLTGEILRFTAPDVEKGKLANFEIVFKNNGTLVTTAKAYMSIKDSYGNPVKAFESLNEQVNPGEEHSSIFGWDAKNVSTGNYIATAKVRYGNQLTPEKTAVFEVYEVPIVLYAGIAILIVIIVFLLIRRAKKRS